MKLLSLLPLLLLLLQVSSLAPASFSSRIPFAIRDSVVPHGWSVRQPVPAHQKIEFTLFLRERNLDQLEQIFEAVSDPENKRWGKFLTKEELDDLTRPTPEAYAQFDEWVKPFVDAKLLQANKYANSIKVSTIASVASALLRAPFHEYQHKLTSKTLIRVNGKASIPMPFAQHVEFVAGISELFVNSVQTNLRGPVHYQQKLTREPSPTILPSLLKQFYGVPSNARVTNPANLQAIAAFNDEFSLGALRSFESDQSLSPANVSRFGPDCFPNCDQYESDLDVQYITSMAPGGNTLFIAQGSQYWILQAVNELLNEIPQKPLVISFSYGWAELDQCEIAVANCPKLGYNSKQYVDATNLIFQKLGVLGLSALVSDGDDGAPSLGGASGNCPIDPNLYCPAGGCSHTTTACNSFTIKNVTSGEECYFPMGIGGDSCAEYMNDPQRDNAMTSFFQGNPSCNLKIEQDNSQLPHIYSECKCSDLQSVTSNGYTFLPFTFNPSNGAIFTADFPTSSPFVTSVGATQFVGSDNDPITSIKEVGCSILRGAGITTGGGFSAFQVQPSYQKAAVQAYLKNPNAILPPAWSFNSSNRGYPDISFCGHKYKIYSSNDNTDNCPCTAGLVDGTSASSPAFAAFVTLINDQLLNKGMAPLGFLNKLLYQMYASNPANFNDISEGENRCSRSYCCLYGYRNAAGSWDPVTGLGTPNYPKMVNYIVHLKEQQKERADL